MAYDRTIAELAALPSHEVQVVNLDIPLVVATLLAALPELRKLQPGPNPQLTLDPGRIDRLTDQVLALSYAHTQRLALARPVADFKSLADDGTALRQRLHAEASNLIEHHLIHPSTIREYTGRTGYKHLSTDLRILTTVLLSSWPAIQHRCVSSRDEIERAEQVATQLLHLAARRKRASAEVAAAAELRARAFTLVTRSYALIRKLVACLRFEEGDADALAPSLYARKRKRGPARTRPRRNKRKARGRRASVPSTVDSGPSPTDTPGRIPEGKSIQ